jgi:hypothetical protein
VPYLRLSRWFRYRCISNPSSVCGSQNHNPYPCYFVQKRFHKSHSCGRCENVHAVLFAAVVASIKTPTRLPHHGGMRRVNHHTRSQPNFDRTPSLSSSPNHIQQTFQETTSSSSISTMQHNSRNNNDHGHHLLHDFESQHVRECPTLHTALEWYVFL